MRNFVADEVRIMRMEMLGWLPREEAIRGSLMVATEPVAARRMWSLPSVVWSVALNWDASVMVRLRLKELKLRKGCSL